MGVKIFKSADEYAEWGNNKPEDIEVLSVVVFRDELVVTYKFV